MGNDEKELLVCPFCGGEAEHDPAHFDGHNPVRDHIGHAIYCADMTCVGCPSFSQTYETEAEAVAAWNRRASTIERLSAIEQERDALREALRPFVEAFDRRREFYANRYQDGALGCANFDKMPDEWPMEKMDFTMADFRRARAALLHEGQG